MIPFNDHHLLLSTLISTALWYFSSSVNAVATQRILHSSDRTLVLWLTTSQLVLGSFISLPFILSKGRSSHGRDGSGVALRSSSHILVGILHYCGCLCTNCGFLYGSASLVQIVKLLEPIQTLVFIAIINAIMSLQGNHNKVDRKAFSLRKIAATLIVIFGTSMLLAQKTLDTPPIAIAFALGSGLCMSLRNVIKKNLQSSEENHSDDSRDTGSTFRHLFLRGLHNFSTITTMSVLPSLAVSFLATIFNDHMQHLPTLFHYEPKAILIEAVLFHCLYNIFSITVLSLTSAPVHSLLNVGKRISNVIVAAIGKYARYK